MWARLVEHGFHLLYHQLAWSYDGVSWVVSRGAWKTWQQVALKYAHGPAILELGHGPGHLLQTMSANKFNPIVGIDRSGYMGRQALPRQSGLRNPALIVRADSRYLPFGNSLFDTVVATFPTLYITHQNTLRQVARVLKPDGRLVIIPGARLTHDNTGNRVISWLYRITGQQDEGGFVSTANWLTELSAMSEGLLHFEAHVEKLSSSEVMVLIGEKKTAV